VVSLARLAQIVERLAAERRPDRIAAAALDSALSATGARGGRLVGPAGPGRSAQLAVEGAPDDAPSLATEIPGRTSPIGRIEVWGAPDDPGAAAALSLVARAVGQTLEGLRLEREQTEHRRRRRLLAAAGTAMREAREPREAVARALAEARALVGAPAAALVAGGAPRVEVAAYDGLDPLPAPEVAALVPPELRPGLAAGRAWCGALAPESPLRRRGFGSATLVGIGADAALGFLAVLDTGDALLGEDDVAALTDLAGRIAAALTTSVLQQEVRELGTVDPLTRFFNARYFHSRVEQECQRALRAGVAVSVATLTLDGLADLRATGRAADADAALEALSAHVAARLRAMDVGSRLAEDQLAVILPEVEGIEALRVGERLRASVREDTLGSLGFTLSVGVASYPDQAGTSERLVASSRSALAWAQRDGGDRTFLFNAQAAEILRAEERAKSAEDEALLTTLSALATAIDARHPSTVTHSDNVARVAALIAAELGMAPGRVEDLRVAGLLHDVGKIGVREELVTKPEPLTDAEREELRRHPEIGERMLSSRRLAPIRPWVLHHHERMDGRGYPAGLSGEAIPQEARILAVANAFDRLASGGPGRLPMPVADVMYQLERRCGGELDPAAVAALRAVVGRGAAGVAPRSA